MKNDRKTLGLVGALVALAISLLGSSAATDEKEEETITGLVIAADWDDEDNVTAVAISVTMIIENEEEDETVISDDYVVADNKKGRELLKLLGEEVRATGKVTTDDEGNKTIHVTAYKVIEEDPNN